MTMILIPANDKLDYEGGSEVGSINSHWDFLREHNGVFWRLVPPGAKWDAELQHDPGEGYFYNVDVHQVTHRFTILQSLRGEDLTEQLQRFVPPFREYHINTGYLFLIDGIFLLNRSRDLNEFNKISDRSPVRRVQNFVWIEDINYE